MPLAHRIDVGRALLVPVFAALVVLNMMQLVDGGTRPIMATLGTVAALGFYVVLTVMYLRRSTASHTDRSPVVWLTAGCATFSPFLIPIVGSSEAGDATATIGSALVALGIGLSVWALLHLRTNISVIPQSRELASSGPYRFFRHPLYVFEYVSAIGLVLVNGGGWAWLVVTVLAALQVLRARWEEALLSDQVVGYTAYAARTPGFK